MLEEVSVTLDISLAFDEFADEVLGLDDKAELAPDGVTREAVELTKVIGFLPVVLDSVLGLLSVTFEATTLDATETVIFLLDVLLYEPLLV